MAGLPLPVASVGGSWASPLCLEPRRYRRRTEGRVRALDTRPERFRPLTRAVRPHVALLEKYTALTGRPALPPPWSFGLWLTPSFTTK